MRKAYWLAVASLPALASVALHWCAVRVMATWDLTPGAPEAPLVQRILVATDNLFIRYLPFLALLLVFAMPAVAWCLSRADRGRPRQLVVREALLWLALACAVWGIQAMWLRQLATAHEFVTLQFLWWLLGCLITLAAASVSVSLSVFAPCAPKLCLAVVWLAYLLLGSEGALTVLLAACTMASLGGQHARAAA